MKTRKTLTAIAVGAGITGIAWLLWPKKNKIPTSAIVDPFDIKRYAGKWNELARLPNLIEEDLRDLTEEYILDDDGKITVVTRAFNFSKNKPVEATGTIKFKGRHTLGKLEVAYFLPIYLDYNILDIDEDYRNALVSGSGTGYLWFLSRDNSMPAEVKKRFLNKAVSLGFDTGKLQWLES